LVIEKKGAGYFLRKGAMTMKHIIKLIALTVFLCIMTCAMCYAEIPHLINYQGKLTDSNDSPLNGSHNVTFRIYDAESGGSLLWQETHTTTIEKGIFSVMLGGVTALNLPFDRPYFLSIQVGGDPEMTPRQRLSSSAYAFMCEDTVSLPRGAIIMWSGSVISIPAGWALCDGTNGTPNLSGKFVKGIPSSSFNPGTTGGTSSITLTETNLPPHTHTGPSHNHNTRYKKGEYSGGNRVAESRLEFNPGAGRGTTHWVNWDTSVYSMGNAGDNPTGPGPGASQSFNILPPYYEIAFIMKIE